MQNRISRFLFLIVAIVCLPLCLKAQIEVYPLISNPQTSTIFSGMRLETPIPASAVDTIKLKLPYIEDFSGAQVPIQKVDTILIDTANNISGYKVTNLKMHGLQTGDSIHVSYIQDGTQIPKNLGSTKYVKVPTILIPADTVFKSFSPTPVIPISQTNTNPIYIPITANGSQSVLPKAKYPNYIKDTIIYHFYTYDLDSTTAIAKNDTTHYHSTQIPSVPISVKTKSGTFNVYKLIVNDTIYRNILMDTLSRKIVDTTYIIKNDSITVIINDSTLKSIRYRVTRSNRDTIYTFDVDTLPITSSNIRDRYSFLLYDNPQLTQPTALLSYLNYPTYINWTRAKSFSYSGVPDSLGFAANNGGVTINDGQERNPISIGVASFDGINYLGYPYSSNAKTNGWADVLLSLPFDLSKHTLNDSIYMSFFWQAGGLGERPDNTDFLLLEFRDVSNNWIPVWQQFGGDTTILTDSIFTVAMIPFDSASYLHKNFQYRFRSYGRISGHFDSWNIDYIYIDTARTILQPYTHDFTLASAPDSLLINYRSVPYKHFVSFLKQNQGSLNTLINQKQFISFRNMNVRYRHYTDVDPIVGITPQFYLKTYDNLGNIYPDTTNSYLYRTYYDTISLASTIDVSKMTAPYVLKQQYSFAGVNTVDQAKYDMSFNNSKTIETYFYDYYAYDDFTPEYTLKSNLSGLKVANQFNILVSDTLTHMDFCFLRNDGPDLTGFTIFMSVWDGNLNVMGTQQAISIAYASLVNGFTRYQFTKPISLPAGTYYFGYQQFFSSPQNLFIGYDRNNNFTSKIFYNSAGDTKWDTLSKLTNIYGAMMIRPVFSKNEILTSIKDPQGKDKQFVVYPNPNNGELHFMGNPEYMTVYDLNGRQLIQESVSTGSVSVSGKLSNGLYLIYLSKGNYTEVHKLILFNE